jgi:hypothetical protein
MKRVLFTILILYFSASSMSKESEFDLESAVPVDNKLALVTILVRNDPVHPGKILHVCRRNESWCNAYYVAVVHTLADRGIDFFAPRNKDKTLNVEGIATIIESWLLRQPTNSKIKFSSSIYKAITEFEK